MQFRHHHPFHSSNQDQRCLEIPLFLSFLQPILHPILSNTIDSIVVPDRWVPISQTGILFVISVNVQVSPKLKTTLNDYCLNQSPQSQPVRVSIFFISLKYISFNILNSSKFICISYLFSCTRLLITGLSALIPRKL